MAITRLKYITNNLIQAVTPTLSGSWGMDADYPKANLTNWRMSKRAGFDTAKAGELVFDMGSAVSIDTCLLFNHNFSSGATVKIQGHTADSWGAPDVDETIVYAENDMIEEFTSASKRYWRLSVSDAGRSLSDIKIGEMVLGVAIELTRNFDWNLAETTAYNNIQQVTNGGNKWSYALYNPKSWVMSFNELLAAQNTLVKAMVDNSTGNAYPFSVIIEGVPYYVRALATYGTARPMPIDTLESGFETSFPLEYGVSGFELTEETRGIS